MRKWTSYINFSLKTAICYETFLLYDQFSFKDKAENLKKVLLIPRHCGNYPDMGAASSQKNIPKFVFCYIQELTS